MAESQASSNPYGLSEQDFSDLQQIRKSLRDDDPRAGKIDTLLATRPQQPSFGEKLTAGYNPGAANLNPALRFLDAAGGAMLSVPSSIYHAIADDPTEQEQQEFQGHTRLPGELAIERITGAPLVRGAQQWADPSTRPTFSQAMSVLPEALGQGVGGYAGSELLGKGAGKVAKAAVPLLEKSASVQYLKALSPTTVKNKFTAQKITPEMLKRGVSGSLEGINSRATNALEDIGPKIDEAVNAPTPAPPPPRIAGLLRAAPTDIPLGESPVPPKMPGGLLPARPMARSNVVGGVPNEELASQLGSTANTVPARIYRQGYTTGSNEAVGEVPEFSGPGVWQTRDPAIANRFTEVPKQPYRIPQAKQLAIQPVLDALESYKHEGIVDGVKVDQNLVNNATQLQDIVKELGPDVSYQSLNKVRRIWDKQVAQAGGYAGKTLAEGSLMDAMREGASAIRSELAKNRPDIAKLNAEYSFWSRVQQVTGDTIKRRTGQEGAVLPKLGAIGGLATGNVTWAGAMYALGRVLQSPRWRTFSAIKKTQIANAMAAGNAATVTKLLGVGAFSNAAQGRQP